MEGEGFDGFWGGLAALLRLEAVLVMVICECFGYVWYGDDDALGFEL